MTPTQPVRWHKAPDRMSNPHFIALTAGARALLMALDELVSIAGTMARCAVLVNLDRKTFTAAVAAMEGKFIEVQRSGDVVTITVTDHRWTTSGPRTNHKRATDEPQTNHTPTTDEPQTSHKELANDAGLPARSLKENESKSKKENITPTPKADDRSADASLTEIVEPVGFSEFYDEFPPGRKNRVDALKAWNGLKASERNPAEILAGLQTAKARYSAEQDMAKHGWKFFKGPGAWLRSRQWLTEYGTAQAVTASGVTMDEAERHRQLIWEFHNGVDPYAV